MAQVLLDGINKVYDNGFHAVHDLTLHIADGEFLVLVGPSGCGKTTAMRMVAGLEDITSGELRIGDRVVNTISPRDRDIAMVFQSYALYPHMTVGDNIAYGLKLRKMPKEEIEARIAKAAKMLELTELLDRKPKQLSGGQRQRVAMGRAIVRQPQVFLMDEPLSNLDAKLRVQMRAEISSVVHELKTTTIYVTHDQVEAMTMGDRIAVMKKGVLQQIGEPQHIYDNPDNIFVAQFIGSPPMNLAMGRIEREGDGLVLVLAGARLTVPASVIAARPKLSEYAGREVAVGVRSEDMEDALFKPDAPEGSRLSSRVVLTEALGSEVIVHFELDASSVETEDTAAIAADSKSEGDVGALAVAGVKWVASFAPRSRVRVGDVIEIVVDTQQIHYFDPQTSAAIR